ncbi:aminotransferase class I/II-fold pyridoxal phosphate-dependent enzyme [Segetibacter sp. 3557_3]|uniref:pyridoxal phosphate-dependent aminotransferase n=1 Tax=Segetibacter sp. 3557_3 TaxID=2547429 RepID=UPI0010586CD6|nr:aminotransferase class I/II-fold pyridoxal phosphate-dependent enzyme [Segetibacter sp. 3557_3]TDH20868.1 aminotransferase class I/II-fold pyridoxal phosphate-dependent enzyme [Segetibacter sp. 3557_3]
MILSKLADTLIGSEIVSLGNQINDRIRQGEKIYNFTIGDFDPRIFPIPRELEEEIINAYRNHQTNYPPADGVAELRSAVCGFLDTYHGLKYEANEVLIAAGGRPLIYCIFRVIVDPGDKVIYAVPSWNNNHYVHMNNGVHCTLEALPEHNFMPTAEQIAPHLDGATLLCLCSPQNPTGTTLQKEDLERICDLVIAENAKRGTGKKLYVLYDQIYSVLTYGEIRHYDPVSLRPEMRDYTVFVDGISKAFSATGLRLGWSFGPATIIAKMKAILSHLGAWSPMAEQKATAVYLKKTPEINAYLANFKLEVEERLRRIYDGFMVLRKMGYKVDAITPQAAIYLTIQLDLTGQRKPDGAVLETQADVTSYILGEAKIAVVPFYAFGASRDSTWYRLSVGTCIKEEIDNMLSNLKNALDGLKND